jgi:hypothetical protein
MPAALQLVVFLCYLIPLHEHPLLALQIAQKKTLGVLSVVAIAWTLNKTYTSLLLHRGSGRAMPMCDVERLHWLLLFCCKCAYIDLAPKWLDVRTTRAQRPQSDALRAVLVIAVGEECLPAAAFININTMYAIQLSLLRTPYICAPGCPLTAAWGGGGVSHFQRPSVGAIDAPRWALSGSTINKKSAKVFCCPFWEEGVMWVVRGQLPRRGRRRAVVGATRVTFSGRG